MRRPRVFGSRPQGSHASHDAAAADGTTDTHDHPQGRHRKPHHHWLAWAAGAVAVFALLWGGARILDLGSDTATSPEPRSSSGGRPAGALDPQSSHVSKDEAIRLVVPETEWTHGEAMLIKGRYAEASPGTEVRVEVRVPSGDWVRYPLPAAVAQDRSFQTYVELAQRGKASVRVVDPTTGATSNVVDVQVR